MHLYVDFRLTSLLNILRRITLSSDGSIRVATMPHHSRRRAQKKFTRRWRAQRTIEPHLPFAFALAAVPGVPIIHHIKPIKCPATPFANRAHQPGGTHQFGSSSQETRRSALTRIHLSPDVRRCTRTPASSVMLNFRSFGVGGGRGVRSPG
jgi:hypothetical protein